MATSSTRNEILLEYLRLSSIGGFSNISLSMLAEAVGIRKSSLYSHFSSASQIKTSLIEMCMTDIQSSPFEFDFKAKNREEFLSTVVGSIIDSFTSKPIVWFWNIVQQQRAFDEKFMQCDEKIRKMILARVRIALEYTVQRSWLDIKDTDIAASFFCDSLCECITELSVEKEKSRSDDLDSELERLVDGLIELF